MIETVPERPKPWTSVSNIWVRADQNEVEADMVEVLDISVSHLEVEMVDGLDILGAMWWWRPDDYDSRICGSISLIL